MDIVDDAGGVYGGYCSLWGFHECFLEEGDRLGAHAHIEGVGEGLVFGHLFCCNEVEAVDGGGP